MSRHRSKLVHTAVAIVLLAVSALLWQSPGTSATYASCVPSNSVCITNSPVGTWTLDGTDHTLYYKLDFSLNSSTAMTWHVTITSTQFTAIATPTHTLSVNASNVTAVATTSACTSQCPNNMILYPLAMPANTPVTFYNNTNKNKGMGTFTIEATIGVSVPGDAYAGTYTCTITIALVNGP